MGDTLKDLVKKINGVGEKTKKYADIVYLFGLVFFLTSQACGSSRVVFVDFVRIFLIAGSLILIITCIYKLFFLFFSNIKLAFLALAVVVLGFVYSTYVPDATEFSIVALAIAGAIGVSADHIVFSGLIANVVLIINNIFMQAFNTSDMALDDLGGHTFFFLGANHFSFPIMNNCSSTDFASHYFFMLLAYLWFRGNKITWGEIFAACSVDMLIYSLTGSNTTFIAMGLIIFFAMFVKIWQQVSGKTRFNEDKGILKKIINGFNSFVVFCFKYSFVIFAGLTIILAIAYSVDNPLLFKLNGILHLRLSLGHRGIIENGIHLFAPEYPIYGARASADGFYNFLDCSYISLLVGSGIIPLLFYVLSMTAVQVKHKKYFFGAALFAVMALASVEEHHLAEIQANFFLLFLFADLKVDQKVSALDQEDEQQKKASKTFTLAGFALCAVFAFVSVLINYPRFKVVNELDALDNKALQIYSGVQSSINSKIADGSWQSGIASVNSAMYGDVLYEPDDYFDVTGSTWNEMTKDPKAHSYYAVYYDSSYQSSDDKMLGLIISDEVKQLVGDGSIVVEYDVSAGEVYSVWYSESKGCYQIEGEGARDASRDARLRGDQLQEGYSTGDKNV